MKKRLCAFLLAASLPLTMLPAALAENETVRPLENFKAEIEQGASFAGFWSVDVAMPDGTARTLYQYAPDTITYCQPGVAIGVPSGVDPVAFLTSTGWKAIMDEQGFGGVLMVAGENGWQADESAYTDAAFEQLDDRTIERMEDSAFYMVGYGDAANAVLAHALVNGHNLAGAAVLGADHIDTALLAAALETEAASGITMDEIELPMWIAAQEPTEETAAVVDFYKKANLSGAEVLSSAFADEIYSFPQHLAGTSQLTYAHCSKVAVTYGLDRTTTAEFTDNLWNNFLRRARRQSARTIAALRPFATNEELGMTRQTIEIDGYTHEFYIYVPTNVKAGKKQNVPLVFHFHGAGGSGENFASRAAWYKVAEERDFIVVFPSNNRKISSAWNETTSIEFFKQMRAYMLDNYSVDSTRVYVTGQSAGGGMTANVATLCPELVAACGSTSMMKDIDTIEGRKTDIVMPFFESLGTLDKHFLPGGDAEGSVPERTAHWVSRYGITATPEDTYYHENGDFKLYEYKNAQGVTVYAQQWVEGKVHAVIPEEAYLLWDFMCQYTRGEDGTSYYLGMPISID